MTLTVKSKFSTLFTHEFDLYVLFVMNFYQEENRLRAKQAKEDLEQFLLHTERMNSSIKYW